MFTVEILKADGRAKTGFRAYNSVDCESQEIVDQVLARHPAPTFQCSVHPTYVERRHALTGAVFMERYDTPYYCSPSSETYWST